LNSPVTGPVARFARQIAGQGYIVAAPSSYHDFTGPEPLAYDVPGTDQGNKWKVTKVGSTPFYADLPQGSHKLTYLCLWTT
jgi:dienelactone hydrolase